MKESIQDTAVLIFANSASRDAIAKNMLAKAALFDAMTLQTLKVVKATGLPYFHFTENEQQGWTFGQRFANAVQSVYAKGYQNIITIGNDSPQLKTWHIKKAFYELQQGKTVLGPALDGGFYLMGMNRSHFDAFSFSKLPWQRYGLRAATEKMFIGLGNAIFRLPILQDLDREADIVLLSHHVNSIAGNLIKLLKSFVKRTRQAFHAPVPILERINVGPNHNKGSPILLFH
ncbi:TIGR04282 family arsenosugar biosynthesis glycosyltransferase [Flagellimonas meishanensis]|uniref:TIGR04282 family arsenosugar biosynthesis glycosyltransferase n=1 Tax=Flagellimonas meishanensis TaxID=2873264 RepID=UPI001CA672F7|nr:DUF2064 domain-containing protein [[Muricauda] meishanensis]